MHSPLLLLWGLENCFEITLKECWKVPVCKKKQQRSILFDTEQKEDWKKVKEQVKLLCSWWFCLVVHSPLLLLWGPEKCRNITECWKVPVRKKKAKRNMFETEHKEDWKETSVQLQRCLCQWSEPLLTWLWPEEEHMDFSNLLQTGVCQHWYMDFCKLLHGFVKVVLYISQWCLCQWSEPLLTWLWEDEEEADW